VRPAFAHRIFFKIVTVCISLLFVLFCFPINAQQSIDSIKNTTKYLTGIQRVENLIKLSQYYSQQNPQQAQKYALEAIEIAKVENVAVVEIRARMALANAYRFQRNFSEVLNVLNPTLPNLDKLDNELAAEILSNIGIAHYQLGHDTVSMDNFFETIGEDNYRSEAEALSDGLKNIGDFYYKTQNYPKAIEFYYKSAQIDSITNDTIGIGNALFSIAEVLSTIERYPVAIRFYSNALSYLKRSRIEPQLLISLAIAYQKVDPNSTEQLIEKIDSISWSRSTYDNFRIHLLKGFHFGYAKQPKNSLLHFDSAAYFASEERDWKQLTEAELEVAQRLTTFGYNSKTFYEHVLSHAKKNYFFQLQGKAYVELAKLEKKIGNTANANFMLSEHAAILDSILAEVKNEAVNSATSQFNLQNLEKKIEAYRYDTKIQNLAIEKERVRRMFLIAILAIVTPLLVLITFLYIERQKVNRFLAEKNHQINQQNEELNAINEQLNSSRQELIALNKTKDKFFSIIAHDLKSPLVSLKSFLTAIKNSKQGVDEKVTVQLHQLEELLSKVIGLINNLLYWALSQEDSIDFNPESFNLLQAINEEVSISRIVAKSKSISLDVAIDEQHITYTDRNMLLFILRNLVANALKFTPPSGTVKIKAEKNEQIDSIIVSDTGTGIETEQLEKLFDLEKKLTPNTSGKREGTGLGLMLCREFAQKMGGKIEVESQPGSGSSFTLTIPNKTKKT